MKQPNHSASLGDSTSSTHNSVSGLPFVRIRARAINPPKKVSIAFHSDLTQPRVAGMVGEDKSNRDPGRIRTSAVDLQHLQYAVAAADHGGFQRAADAPLLRQGPHPIRCPLQHFKTKLICREIDRDSSGSRNSKRRAQDSAGRQPRRLQVSTMLAGVSSLTAGISKEIPAFCARRYIQRSLTTNRSI
jgi:hypothetical protein